MAKLITSRGHLDGSESPLSAPNRNLPAWLSWTRMPVAWVGLFAVAYAAILLLAPSGAALPKAIDVAMPALVAGGAALVTFRGTSRPSLDPVRRRVTHFSGWGLVGACVGNSVIALPYFAEMFHGRHAMIMAPPLVGGLFALTYLCLLIAAFSLIGYPASWYARGRLAVDGLMLMVTAFAYSWFFLIAPALSSARPVEVDILLAAVLPLCDLVVLVPVVLMWLTPTTREMVPIRRLVGAALLSNVAGDCVISFLTIHSPNTVGTVADIFTPVALLLLALAVRRLRYVPSSAVQTRTPATPHRSLGRTLLPYMAMLLIACLVAAVLRGQSEAQARAGVLAALAAFVVLLVLRHLLALLGTGQAETQGRQSEARLRAVLNHAPITFFVLDSAGHCTLATGRENAGLGGELPINAMAMEFFLAQPDVRNACQTTLAGLGAQVMVEIDRATIDCRLEPIRDAAGRVVEVVGVAVDVTETVRAQRAAEDLVRLRSDFVAAVSHELRTPLTAIAGYAELLQARWSQMDDTQRLRQIDQIVLAAARQQRLVADLLLLSRAEAHDVVAQCGEVEAATVVERAASEVRASYRGQEIITDGPPDLLLWADADRSLQILVNLLDNAAKYSDEDSPIHVAWRAVDDRMAAIAVIDHGPGIPASGRTRLFTRFGRVPESRVRAGRVGTGLGLFLGRILAQAMSGSLELQTTGPEGSTFCLTLPLAPDDHAGETASTPSAAEGQGFGIFADGYGSAGTKVATETESANVRLVQRPTLATPGTGPR